MMFDNRRVVLPDGRNRHVPDRAEGWLRLFSCPASVRGGGAKLIADQGANALLVPADKRFEFSRWTRFLKRGSAPLPAETCESGGG